MDTTSKYVTKKDWAVEALRKAIITGEYWPGQRVRQDEVAERLSISLTPVREAFSQLEVEGIITRAPHKGARVAQVSTERAREIYRIRSVLEGLAIELAVPNVPKSDLARLERL